MHVIVVDSATPAVTAALIGVDAGRLAVVAHRRTVDARGHGELLAPHLDAVLREAGLRPQELDAVVAGVGPGPFTGLRVGLVTAAALGQALGIPTYGVSSLDAIGYATANRMGDATHAVGARGGASTAGVAEAVAAQGDPSRAGAAKSAAAQDGMTEGGMMKGGVAEVVAAQDGTMEGGVAQGGVAGSGLGYTSAGRGAADLRADGGPGGSGGSRDSDDSGGDGGVVLVATDARRREVYWAVYRNGAALTGPAVARPAEVAERAAALGATAAVGEGAYRYADVLGLPVRDEPRYPPPLALAALAADRIRAGAPSERLVPCYLRRPDAVAPAARKSVLPARRSALP